ncbi:MAG: hypothetical protein H0U42_01005 [Thermoleophilaceae bacterium]|nr:hypothetical protein [Thermoleophilaceae bacterium]
MRPLQALRARARSLPREDGFSLIELLVASTLSIFLLLVIAGFADIAQRSQSDTGARSDTLGRQRAALERMTRELRQATTVNATTAGLVEFQVYGSAAGVVRQIRFDCRFDARCRRYEGPAGGAWTLTDDSLVDSVQSATFTTQTLAASQDYIGIDLRVSLPGRPIPIALADGVHLRNKATP